MPDADYDREDDRAWVIDGNAGYIVLSDNDTSAPLVGPLNTNLLVDPGFESTTTSWSYWGNEVGRQGFATFAAESGIYGVWLTNSTVNGASWGFAQRRPGSASTTYYASIRARKIGAVDPYEVVLRVLSYNSAGVELGYTDTNIIAGLTTDWKTFGVTVTTPVGTVTNELLVQIWNDGSGGGEGIVYFDNAVLAQCGARPLRIYAGSTELTASEDTSNAYYYISSSVLTNVSAGSPFRLVLSAYDPDSGLSRGTGSTDSQSHLSIGTAIQTNNAQYYETESTAYAGTFTAGATSVWRWTSFSQDELTAMIAAQTNRIIMTIRDADNNRTDDRMSATNVQFGYLIVTSPPASQVGMIYDWFPNSGRLYNQGGGTGWGTNLWACSDDDDHMYDNGSFNTNKWSCPDTQGNKAKLIADFNGDIRYANRQFGTNFTSGKVYFYWMQNFDHTGGDNSAYAGLYIMSNDTEEVFIGKTPGNTTLGFAWWAGSAMTNSAQQMLNGMGNDYVVIARYDFATRELSASAYPTTNSIAEEPAGYWDVTVTLGAGDITYINGVRIKGGVFYDDYNNIGNVYFDEIRVGTNWYEVTRKDGELYSADMANGPVQRGEFAGARRRTASVSSNATGRSLWSRSIAPTR